MKPAPDSGSHRLRLYEVVFEVFALPLAKVLNLQVTRFKTCFVGSLGKQNAVAVQQDIDVGDVVNSNHGVGSPSAQCSVTDADIQIAIHRG